MGNAEIAVFVGLQAAGKSTFWRERLSATHVLVSKDRMPNRRDLNRRQAERVAQALRAGRSVAVDNTHPRRDDRAPLIALGRALGARVVGYYVEADKAACLERNARREGKARVPDVAIHVAASRLQPPSLDEGFDALFRVHIQDAGFAVTPWGGAEPSSQGSHSGR